MNIGLGFSSENDPILAVKEAARIAQHSLAFAAKIDLALVFASEYISSPTMLKTAHEYLEGIPLIGCSGACVLSNHGVLNNGIGIMLLGFPEGAYFNTAVVKEIKNKTPTIAGEELGEKLLYGCKNVRRDLSIMLFDGMMGEQPSLIFGLQERLGRSFPLIGGSASAYSDSPKTYIYYNHEILSDAATGILLGGGKICFGTHIRHGWKPLGKPRTVTFSQGNVVYEIDGMPAVKLYEEYLAKDIAELKKVIRNISALYPFGIHLPNENNYLLRNVTAIVDSGALRFQGEIPQGSQIRLMIGTRESCLEAVREAAEQAKKELYSQAVMARKKDFRQFVLVFDSAARHILLSRDAYKEIEIIKAVFGQETPIMGVATSGELASLQTEGYHGKVYFHNQSINIVAIGG
jgi:hypothetical protein